MRVAMNDMSFSTFNGYRKILKSVWRPKIGKELFDKIIYSRLQEIAAEHAGITTEQARASAGCTDDTAYLSDQEIKKRTKKTYNNVVSVLRCAFDFGYKDHPEKHNPASALATFRITKKDRTHDR
jgi:site-specific recombinase XerD